MSEYRTPEELERASAQARPPEKEEYVPRPKWQLVLAWILAAAVLAAFLGICYWLAFGKF